MHMVCVYDMLRLYRRVTSQIGVRAFGSESGQGSQGSVSYDDDNSGRPTTGSFVAVPGDPVMPVNASALGRLQQAA